MTGEEGAMPRVKPFKYTYEKEIVMYAYFKRLDYFSTECKYSPFAARGFAREFVKDLEVSPGFTSFLLFLECNLRVYITKYRIFYLSVCETYIKTCAGCPS